MLIFRRVLCRFGVHGQALSTGMGPHHYRCLHCGRAFNR